jgi:hypothetical protein
VAFAGSIELAANANDVLAEFLDSAGYAADTSRIDRAARLVLYSCASGKRVFRGER